MKKILNEIMKGFSYFLPVIVVAAILEQLSIVFNYSSEDTEFFSFSSYYT